MTMQRLGVVLALLFLAMLPAVSWSAECVDIDEISGVLVQSSDIAPNCAGLLVLDSTEFEMLRNPFATDPDWEVVQWSLGATVLFWVIGVCSGAVYRVVRVK